MAEIHMEVNPSMTVREGHSLSHELRRGLLEDDALNLEHVVVHIESPEFEKRKGMYYFRWMVEGDF